MNKPDPLVSAMEDLVRLKSVTETGYGLRLRLAARIVETMNEYIAETVLESVDHTKPGHMTWEKVGEVFGLSKSAVFSRYGKRRN